MPNFAEEPELAGTLWRLGSVEVSVDYVIRLPRPRAAVILPMLVGLMSLGGTTACDEQNTLLTDPPTAARLAPQKTVVVANVTVLPTLGGTWTFAQDINDQGQVVGMSYLAGDTIYHAFLWTPSHGMQDLGTLGGLTSTANAVNEVGQVVGESSSASGRRAFLWTRDHGMQDLGTLGGTYSAATDINDAGQVVGYTGSADAQVFNERAFLWTPAGGMHDLGSLGGVFSRAEGINNAGQVVGESQTRRIYHAFLWTAGTGMQDLGTFPGPDGVASFATDINDAGQVVGSGNVDGGGTHPFLWTPAHGMQDLGTIGGEEFASGATGIDDLGDVVGGSGGLPFIWTNANGIEDLHVMTGFNTASAINNHGQVVSGNRVVTIRVTSPNHAPVAVTAGFTTGSGFYSIPRGRRKAHFTFTAKFQPGRPTAPNGTARFWIPGDQVDFETAAIEMLVITGNRAQFWGAGMFNGAPARFRITVVDGDHGAGNVDAFRIELWQGGVLVFDTQPGAAQDAPVTTSIDGGSIQIHSE